jgi:GNAT superfamily N-acetyltransferase
VKARTEAGRLRRALYRRPAEAGAVPLRRLDRWQAETMREDLADLYVESSSAAPGQGYRSREEFLGRLAEDVRRPGFDMLIAEGASLAGCVFGFPVGRDGSWWQGFVGALPENLEQLTASGHVFAVSDILIHPDERDQGLGRRLQAGLLADQDSSLGVTMLDRADDTASAAFLSWGWQELGEVLKGSAPASLRVLAVHIGERTAESPDGLAHDARTQRPEGSAGPL